MSKHAGSQRVKKMKTAKILIVPGAPNRSIFLLNAFLRVVGLLEATYYLFDLLRIANVALSKVVLLCLFQLDPCGYFQPLFEVGIGHLT